MHLANNDGVVGIIEVIRYDKEAPCIINGGGVFNRDEFVQIKEFCEEWIAAIDKENK